MPLDDRQQAELECAISNYTFPPVYYDWAAFQEVAAANVGELECVLRTLLISENPDRVRDGLANVLYWGYARIGYRDTRVRNLRTGITSGQIADFQALVRPRGDPGAVRIPTLQEIAKLRMPEFSGISFISKILMFLDPCRYCVLDNQLARLADNAPRAIYRLRAQGQLPVNEASERAYEDWRTECLKISHDYYDERYRAVDIERGFFTLIQSNQLPLACTIYANSCCT